MPINPGNRITRRLLHKGRQPVKIRAVFNHVELPRKLIEGKLNMINPHHSQLPGNFKGHIPHILNLAIQ